MRPQIAAVRLATSNQQVRPRLLRRLVQHFGHVAAADKYFGLDSCLAQQLRHPPRSIADQRCFPFLIDVPAAWSPKLHSGCDMRERKPGAKFCRYPRGPHGASMAMLLEVNRA